MALKERRGKPRGEEEELGDLGDRRLGTLKKNEWLEEQKAERVIRTWKLLCVEIVNKGASAGVRDLEIRSRWRRIEGRAATTKEGESDRWQE